MGEVVRCDCGFEAQADDEEGLVAAVRRHALEVHGMALSHDDALRVAARARTKKPHPGDKEEA